MTMKTVHTANFSHFVSIKCLEDSCGTLAIMQAVWPDNVFRMEAFNRSCCTCMFFSISYLGNNSILKVPSQAFAFSVLTELTAV